MENMFRRYLCKIPAILPLEMPCELQAIISNKPRATCHAGAYQMLNVMLAVDYDQFYDGDDRCLPAVVDHKQGVAHRKLCQSRLPIWIVRSFK